MPTSEDNGTVAFSDLYTYDPGYRWGEENRGPIPVSMAIKGMRSDGVVRTSGQAGGYGMVIRARALCLQEALGWNWTTGIRANFMWNLASCLPMGSAWQGRGYLGCLVFSTGISQVRGFVENLIDAAC